MIGKIRKGIAGFYYVQTEIGLIECKARGLFRKTKENILVGDDVRIEYDEQAGKGYLVEILPRRNSLLRPAVSNVDQIVLFFALEQPKTNLNLLDRFLVMLEQKEFPIFLALNKSDLVESGEEIADRYRRIGYPVFVISALKEDLSGLKDILIGKTTALAGPSGSGKSTLVNLLQSVHQQLTGEVSEKIGRGKHTTREVYLIPLEEGGYIFDTPGFTSLDINEIKRRELRNYFPEFRDFSTHCRFLDCLHEKERDCKVKEAVVSGEVAPGRYESYIQILNELKS